MANLEEVRAEAHGQTKGIPNFYSRLNGQFQANVAVHFLVPSTFVTVTLAELTWKTYNT